MQFKEAISKRVKDLCFEYGLTVHGLSLKTGVSNSTLDDIVKARNESVQLKFIFAICDGLNISLEEFFHSPYFDTEQLID